MAEIIGSKGGKFNKKTLILAIGGFVTIAAVSAYLFLGGDNSTPTKKVKPATNIENTNANYSGNTLDVDKDVKEQRENKIKADRESAKKDPKNVQNQIESVPVDANYVKGKDINPQDLLTKDEPCLTTPFDAQGFDCKTGFNKEGYNRQGFDKQGFNKQGCDANGLDITGKPCGGNFLGKIDKSCIDKLTASCDKPDDPYKDGYDKDGYDRNGFDRQGFNKQGCDRQGFDKDGYHCTTKLNRSGFDRNGCDKDGYDKDGYSCKTKLNRDGYDKEGYDADGFDKNGCNREGYDRNGKACQGGRRSNVKLSEGEKLWYANQLKAKDNYLAEIEKSMDKKNIGAARFVDLDAVYQEKEAKANANKAKETPADAPTVADKSTDDKEKNNPDIEIPTGTMLYASVQADINSDYPGMVRAKVLGGPLDQSMLLGSYTVPFIDDPYRPRDKIKIEFKQLIYSRITFPINAAGLDTASMTDYIAGDVNYHYFTRWGGLIGANVLKGIGKAVATQGSTYSNDGSGTIYQTPITATGDQLKVAAGEVGSELSQIARKQFDRPPTVTSDRGTMIAVFFLSEVNDDRLPMLFNTKEQLEMNQKMMLNPKIDQ